MNLQLNHNDNLAHSGVDLRRVTVGIGSCPSPYPVRYMGHCVLVDTEGYGLWLPIIEFII